MPVLQRVRKATTHRGKRYLLSREPKVIEDKKQTLFIQGRKTSLAVTTCMKNLYDLKKPDGIMLKRKNDILPFENIVPIEDFARKRNASLFLFGSHSKKRPDNIVIGRMYDWHLLDMFELGIDYMKALQNFKTEKVALGLKPCLLFAGELFEQNHEYQRLKSLLIDFFQRETVEAVRLQGLEHVLMFVAAEDKIYLRSYRVLLKKSGLRTPRVELVEIGPSINFKLRRTKLASDDHFKVACKKPAELKVKKVKNISRDNFGSQLGRIHVPAQNINRLQTRKMKGLKKTPAEKSAAVAVKRKHEEGEVQQKKIKVSM